MVNTLTENKLIKDEISENIIDITKRLAEEEGAHNVTVRQILKELNVTNRVFYNRFHNVEEVLEFIYRRAVVNMRKSFNSKIDSKTDVYDYCLNVATSVISNTYEIKTTFNQYMLEHEELTQENYSWWRNEITKIFNYALEKKMVKNNIDTEMLSYSIWCFCRGFSADALSRHVPKDEAIKYFRFAFGCFLNGLRQVN